MSADLDTLSPRFVYKILHPSAAPPVPLPLVLPLSSLDAKDGFFHLSTAPQVPGTADMFFDDCKETLVLLRIRFDVISSNGTVKWENGGCVHLYDGKLGREEVVDVLVVRRPKDKSWKESFRGFFEAFESPAD